LLLLPPRPQVAYGGQQHKTELFLLQANGQVQLNDATLLFADTRPLQQDHSLTIHAYVTKSRTAKGRLLGRFAVPCSQLLAQCEAATAQLPPRHVAATYQAVAAAGGSASSTFAAAAGAAAAAAAAAASDATTTTGGSSSSNGAAGSALQRPVCPIDTGVKGEGRLGAVARQLAGRAGGVLILHAGMADADLRAEQHNLPLYAAGVAHAPRLCLQPQPHTCAVRATRQQATLSSSAGRDAVAAAAAAASRGPGGLSKNGSLTSPFATVAEDEHEQQACREQPKQQQQQLAGLMSAQPSINAGSSLRQHRDAGSDVGFWSHDQVLPDTTPGAASWRLLQHRRPVVLLLLLLLPLLIQ
jgi:hypothetical protein